MHLDILKYYISLLKSGSSLTSLESIQKSELNLSDQAIKERIEITIDAFQKLTHSGISKSHRAEIISKISKDGKTALEAVRDENADALKDSQLTGALEVIVKLDGTRPSFLIKDGQIDKSSGTVGLWETTLDVSKELLSKVIGSVGRISKTKNDVNYFGTGFLIHQDLVVTNHHILQEIAILDHKTKKWVIQAGSHIDFGCEYNGSTIYPAREITEVIFTLGDNSLIRYQNTLDMAILKLAPSNDEFEVFKLSDQCPVKESQVFTIGYSGPVALSLYGKIPLYDIFRDKYGFKRLAPGFVADAFDILPAWSFAYDATTSGGNSGSVVVAVGEEDCAIGLHYGGRASLPVENYAHSIVGIQKKEDVRDEFNNILEKYGIQF